MDGVAVEPCPVVVQLVAVAEIALHALRRPEAEAAVVLVARGDDAQRVAGRALAQAERGGVGERAREQRLDARRSPSGLSASASACVAQARQTAPPARGE